MLILKHIKTLQHVSIIIQIIFRELIGSLLVTEFKIKNVKGQLWWCGSITFGVCAWCSWMPCTHTKRYAAASPQLTFYILKFKFIDFNKEPTNFLKMIWIMIETYWNVVKCFNINILD